MKSRHIYKVTLDLSKLDKEKRSDLLETLSDQKRYLEDRHGEVALELDFVGRKRFKEAVSLA